MSDTHDNMEAIEQAVNLINKENISIVIHAGDLISPFTARHFKNLKAEFHAVFGNNDGEKDGLRKKFNEFGKIHGTFMKLDVEDIKIACIHGDIFEIVQALVKSKEYNVVVSGHLHSPKIEKIEKVLHINPGEVCGYLSDQKTMAILEIETLEAEIIEI